MNKIELMGRLVADVEVKKGKTGTEYTNFTIAVPRKGNKEITDFINCVAFGKICDALVKYTEKGNRIIVTGSLNLDKFTDKDGNSHTSVTILVDDFYFVDFKAKKEEN